MVIIENADNLQDELEAMISDALPSFTFTWRTCETHDVGFGLIRRRRTFGVAYRNGFCRIHCDWRDLYEHIANTTSLTKTRPQDALVALPDAVDNYLSSIFGKLFAFKTNDTIDKQFFKCLGDTMRQCWSMLVS